MDIQVVSVNTSEKKGVKKRPVAKVNAKIDFGIENDAHAGKWHRQVSLLAIESVKKMEDKGMSLSPGDFGENITTKGVVLHTLPVGSMLKIGESVLLEVSQIGKKCHSKCEIFNQVGDCIMPNEGIFAKVIKGGNIEKDDLIEIVS
ncbi:MAG: MOSC domain-containing protein [Candidatus Anammoxibacter sp.]